MALFRRRPRPDKGTDKDFAEALAMAHQVVGKDREMWRQSDDLPPELFEDCLRGAEGLLQALHVSARDAQASSAEYLDRDIAFGPGLPEMSERFATGLSDFDGAINCCRLGLLVLAAETTIRAFDDPIEQESRILSMRFMLAREKSADHFCEATLSDEVPKPVGSDPRYVAWLVGLLYQAATGDQMQLPQAADPWLIGIYGPCLNLGRGMMAGLSLEEASQILRADAEV